MILFADYNVIPICGICHQYYDIKNVDTYIDSCSKNGNIIILEILIKTLLTMNVHYECNILFKIKKLNSNALYFDKFIFLPCLIKT